MDENKAHILVIDDDRRISELISQFLRQNDLLVSHAASASEARDKMRSFIFDLLILDVMMPEETGLEFVKSLESGGVDVRPPVLMLTALSKTQERITGLEAGADDYLSKPFEPKELLLRIQKLLQRTRAPENNAVKMGAVLFENSILTHEGTRVPLSSSEEDLLRLLASQPYKVISRETIAKRCGLESLRAVDVRMNRLRQKIEPNTKQPVFLQTVRGEGYILKPE